jgi:hypothetical protein
MVDRAGSRYAANALVMVLDGGRSAVDDLLNGPRAYRETQD